MWAGVLWMGDQVAHGNPGWYCRVIATNTPARPLIGEIKKSREETPDHDEGEVERLRSENERLREELKRRGA